MVKPAENYLEVLESIRAYNQGINENIELEAQIPYNRSWFYAPELDMVGPSKFSGYGCMTVKEYLSVRENLDGRVTERVLSQWFEPLIPDAAETKYVKNLVERLASRHNKLLNSKTRFNAKKGWSLSQPSDGSKGATVKTNVASDEERPSTLSLYVKLSTGDIRQHVYPLSEDIKEADKTISRIAGIVGNTYAGNIGFFSLNYPLITYNASHVTYVEYVLRGPEEWKEIVADYIKEPLGFKTRT